MIRRLIPLGALLLITSAAAAPEQRQLDAHQRVIIYDHSVPADSSIFLALQRAGLNPKDEDVPGAPVSTIIVGPRS
jgi:hypothetical protein